jgi:hypothetical protein
MKFGNVSDWSEIANILVIFIDFSVGVLKGRRFSIEGLSRIGKNLVIHKFFRAALLSHFENIIYR